MVPSVANFSQQPAGSFTCIQATEQEGAVGDSSRRLRPLRLASSKAVSAASIRLDEVMKVGKAATPQLKVADTDP